MPAVRLFFSVACLALATMTTSATSGITKTLELQHTAEPPPFRELGALAKKPTARECEARRRSGNIRRLAFVVGNNKTQNYNLENAIADAVLMEGTLLDLGYEVASTFDARRQDLLARLDRFKEHVQALCDHDIALFYYAGNGFEISGITYIATPEVHYPLEPGTELETLLPWLKLTDILARMSHHPGAKIIMIDTCRHDPLAKFRSPPTPPPGGFRLPPNTLISYASEPGHESNDIGPNGTNGSYAYFTSKLLKDTSKSRDALTLFNDVRAAVAESTSRLLNFSPADRRERI